MDNYEIWLSHEISCWDILDNENIWSVSIIHSLKTTHLIQPMQIDFWVICFVPKCLFHFIGAKLCIFLSWCQIVRLPSWCQIIGFNCHSEKLSGAKLSGCQIVLEPSIHHKLLVKYGKFLLWTCKAGRKEVLCFERFKLFESVLKTHNL